MKMEYVYQLTIVGVMISVANAATIAVNFTGRSSSSGATPDALLTQTGSSAGAAAGVNGTTTFTDVLANYNTLATPITLAVSGTGSSSASMTFISGGSWSKTASTSRAVANENASGDLTDGHIEGNNPIGISVTLNSLNFVGSYDLYVYIGDDAGGRNASITVDGITRTYTSTIHNGTFIDASAGGGATGDYMVFSGLTGSTQVITLGGIDNANRSGLNGFEIIGTVPEPSSASLLGLGGLALVLRRRK